MERTMGGQVRRGAPGPLVLVAVHAGGHGGTAHVIGRGQDAPIAEGLRVEAVVVQGVVHGGDGGDGLLVGLFEAVERQRRIAPRRRFAAQLRDGIHRHTHPGVGGHVADDGARRRGRGVR